MSTDMSSATREVLGRVRQLVPPMLDSFHKGELQLFQARMSCISSLVGREEDETGS